MDDTRRLLREIDEYVVDLYAPSDEALEAALRESERAGLPRINVSASSGKLLQLLVEISGARRILELGTLGGYSTIHFARALPDDGRVLSLELEEHHAAVARQNIERAGLSDQTDQCSGQGAKNRRNDGRAHQHRMGKRRCRPPGPFGP